MYLLYLNSIKSYLAEYNTSILYKILIELSNNRYERIRLTPKYAVGRHIKTNSIDNYVEY